MRDEPGVPWLDDDELRSWIPVMAMLMTLPSALDAQLRRDAGVNLFEYIVLAALSDARGLTMTATELSSMSRGSVSRISHAVTRLEKSGWIERVPSAHRARRQDVRMTPAGMERVRQIAPGHVRETRRLVLDALGPAGFADLGVLALAVVEAIDAQVAADVRSHLPT